MALIKLSNNGVKNITSVGNVGTGELKFISKQTASSSASISFTSGIDSTYKEYIFYFVNIHPATDDATFKFQASTNSGSSYGINITSTYFVAVHDEADTSTSLEYNTDKDLAQSTNFQNVISSIGNDNDQSGSGTLQLFNPSSTTFVKHFVSRSNRAYSGDYTVDEYMAGYYNTTSAIDAIQFKFSSGNIDSGDILLYGVN
jgi:hypothetical protein